MRKATRYITVTVEIEEADGQYAARCVELGTASCGDTLEEAFTNIKEAMAVDLNALEEVGEREEFFKERGIKIRERVQREHPLMKPVSSEAWTRVYDAKVRVPA